MAVLQGAHLSLQQRTGAAYTLQQRVSVPPQLRRTRPRSGSPIANSGIMNPPMDALTAEGYDMQWGTNVLGHFYFTELLIPVLVAGAKTSPDGHARVITTSSSGAYAETLPPPRALTFIAGSNELNSTHCIFVVRTSCAISPGLSLVRSFRRLSR